MNKQRMVVSPPNLQTPLRNGSDHSPRGNRSSSQRRRPPPVPADVKRDDDWYSKDPKTSKPIGSLLEKMNALSSLDTPGERMSPVKLGLTREEYIKRMSLSMSSTSRTSSSSSSSSSTSNYVQLHNNSSAFITTPHLHDNASSMRFPTTPTTTPTTPTTPRSIFSNKDPFDRARLNRTPTTPTTPSHVQGSSTPIARRDWGRRDGVHWWLGCGKMKSSIAKMAVEISKLRSEIDTRNLVQVPHPEIYIAEHKPSISVLNGNAETFVNEVDAQRDGCSMCRWEVEQYVLIGKRCQEVLKKSDEEEERMALEKNKDNLWF
jgi:hypothetical protein